MIIIIEDLSKLPGARVKKFGINLLAILLAVSATAVSYRQMVSTVEALQPSRVEEALYLPNGEGLEALSFGYRNVLANMLWFNSVNYFGKHFKSDRNYEWLSHMCGLVTRLDPRLRHVFEFCGLMLAWEARRPEEGAKVLSEGINHHPEYWKFPYLRGMIYLVFLRQPEKANADLVRAAKLPGAHTILITLAAKTLTGTDSFAAAKEFLRDAIKTATNDWERKVFLQRLREIEAAESASQKQ